MGELQFKCSKPKLQVLITKHGVGHLETTLHTSCLLSLAEILLSYKYSMEPVVKSEDVISIEKQCV